MPHIAPYACIQGFCNATTNTLELMLMLVYTAVCTAVLFVHNVLRNTTVRASPIFYNQTLMSLRYAGRARDIKNIPTRVVDVSNSSATAHDASGLRSTVAEIERLKSQLDARTNESDRLKEAVCSSDAEKEMMRKQLATLKKISETEKAEMDKLLNNVIRRYVALNYITIPYMIMIAVLLALIVLLM
jgi:hypothetical protein